MSHIKYRKDIDGLRALAIIPVILFHLDISWIRGGFLGVDIFFVISGYLISSIILRDLKTGTFSIKNFYLRRIRRISPALITVLLVSSIFAWIVLLPQDLLTYAKSVISTILSVSNLFFFYTLNFGYFSSDSNVIPLLHTWSLGIEEQFYFFWPIILIIVFKFKLNSSKKLFFICLSLLIISLILYFFSDAQYYYFPLTRAFELLFGCLIAIIINLGKPKFPKNEKTNSFFSFICFLFIIISLFADVKYGSVWPVIICIGTAGFIYLGANQKYFSFCHRIFSNRVLVSIGLISYSLYLWHWPIIAFINYLSIEKAILVDIVIIFLTFLLAILTYFFVEKPFRYRKSSLFKSFNLLIILPLLLCGLFFITIKEYPNAVFNNTNTSSTSDPNSLDKMINCWNRTPLELTKEDIEKCVNNKKTDVVLFGDSHAMASSHMVNIWLRQRDLSGVIFGTDALNTVNGMYNQNIKQKIQNIIDITHPKYIIFAGWWTYYTKDTMNGFNGLEEAIKTSLNNNIKTLLILDAPSLFEKKPYCSELKLSKILNINCDMPYKNVINEQKESLEQIKKIKKDFPSLEIIDIKKITCDKSTCFSAIENNPIYLDNTKMKWNYHNCHLNTFGSQIIGKLYMEKYGNPLN
ncbi:acyltransferase family protein [Pseudofrancisella aestuarii]|uniref:acyltransferase family protein n=1 Tax=Pseudofrancisella aestuarii TaxID=2670347 RepID=UPI00133057B0|nr:acyltransferase family protein [Pseudofrancisella aestuarii]